MKQIENIDIELDLLEIVSAMVYGCLNDIKDDSISTAADILEEVMKQLKG